MVQYIYLVSGMVDLKVLMKFALSLSPALTASENASLNDFQIFTSRRFNFNWHRARCQFGSWERLGSTMLCQSFDTWALSGPNSSVITKIY